MTPEERKNIDRLTAIASQANNGIISLEKFQEAITPKMVLNLVKLFHLAEMDIRRLQESAQTLDMGMFELADIFGDDKTCIPADYLYSVANRVKSLLKQKTANA